MGLIRLTSSNPKLSFIIKKNPSSGLVLRKLRKGTVFGWYSKEDTYNIYFEDSLTETSYNSGDYEYLDTTRYVSALMIMNCVDELLNSVRKAQAPEDSGDFEHSIFFNAIQIDKKTICNSFTNYFNNEYGVKLVEVAHKCYQVTISTKKSLHDLVNCAMFFALMAALSNGERIEGDAEYVQKYVNVINTIDAPYYLRYTFSKRLIRVKKMFLKFKPQLDTTKRYSDFDLSFGGTAEQRLSNLMTRLSFKNPIIDIGCNTGNNAIQLARRLQTTPYYAVDVDQGVIAKLHKKIAEEGVTNISTFLGLETLLESGVIDSDMKYDVLLTEVVEHMAVEEAEKLIHQILNNINFNTFTITTPNKNFNIHYNDGEKMRHHDHKWEMKVEEFNAWIDKVIPNHKKEFFGTGCKVDNQYVTCGVIVTN